MPIILEIPELDKFRGDVSQAAQVLQTAVKFAMTQSVNTVMVKARSNAPYKTGTLRRSIYSNVQDSGFTGIVAQDSNIASYGVYMEYGTSAHDIYPVAKKALFWKGALHPVKMVHHPGFAPRPFMMPALQDSTDAIIQYFSDALNKAVLYMAGKD